MEWADEEAHGKDRASSWSTIDRIGSKTFCRGEAERLYISLSND